MTYKPRKQAGNTPQGYKLEAGTAVGLKVEDTRNVSQRVELTPRRVDLVYRADATKNTSRGACERLPRA